MSLTAVRSHLRDLLAEIPGQVTVYAGPGDYLAAEQHFVVRVVLGEPSEENEELLDKLLSNEPESVKAAIESSRDPDIAIGGVTKHSGYRLYPQPEGPHLLGAEWTVNVIV